MTNKIRATIIREELKGVVLHEIELDMVDEDDVEKHICTIYVDEIEMAEDFVTELYKELGGSATT